MVFRIMAYIVMAYVVMVYVGVAYIVMAYVVKALYSYGARMGHRTTQRSSLLSPL